MILDPVLMRAWCEGLARGVPYQDIRPQGEALYLRRYFVAGWTPTNGAAGPALFLHHFLSSDPEDAVHSHPWTVGLSLILVGGYTEYRLEAGDLVARTCRPGEIVLLRPSDRHRIDLLDRDCWSLFLAGRSASNLDPPPVAKRWDRKNLRAVMGQRVKVPRLGVLAGQE